MNFEILKVLVNSLIFNLAEFKEVNFDGKWFEPRSISSLYSVIVWVRVVLKRTVVGGLQIK